ncbi:Toluene-4-sulfonate monooxygenase system iron-sulfur subunit TsaM1 [Zhongshania aliphaticivorans]|uniref:Toluene-4-sulfonate monooxygenase system iron-sulfur subunit TsaM1 n=1 Tax=Zhongshania aliphaticivorans TaxID=1470434 RepID=A0A5S9NRI7_9GAMM|nr:aromatic ring-hydroxylating dioxygenase subunit alpha [Zhongshania aliphaticivorans]CAA0093105.1 Toluene-4-sulfonate monooxygenase system iron-sulfur subunit TsaM1 [Zhongshania aliphaticivorans]CAA0110883.1 Toluene-4-sulfonate monooxygenase system iron-sulfur subunit TsaM1 [Zhongshania aliphaticivorans]
MSDLKTIVRDTQSYINLPLLYEHWYVAGLSEDFSREPLGRTLLEKSIVFYRTEAGDLVALQNRCLHRSFPLAESKLKGDNIVCGYHGIEYSPEGEINNVPCQTQCPSGKLRKYPTKEAGPFVFIWMGNPENADESKLPNLDYLENPNYLSFHGVKYLEGNYLLMQENLNDLTHFTFLHANTFGADNKLLDDSFLKLPLEYPEINGVTGCYRILNNAEVLKAELSPEQQAAVGDSELVNKNGGITHSPGVWLGSNVLQVKTPAPGQPESYNMYINHYLTPEKHNSCHYWYSVTADYLAPDPDVIALMQQLFSTAFEEDVYAVKHMQHLLSEDTTDYKEINIAGDKAGVQIRRKILEWAKEENPTVT